MDYADMVQWCGVDPDENAGDVTIVYAVRSEDAACWDVYDAADDEWLESVCGTQHDLVEFCMVRDWDLRDGPLSTY